MFYVFKKENDEYTFKCKTTSKNKPRGSYISIESSELFFKPDYIDGELVENEEKKGAKDLKDQKRADAKEYLKAIDAHIDAATTIKQLKDVVKQLARLIG